MILRRLLVSTLALVPLFFASAAHAQSAAGAGSATAPQSTKAASGSSSAVPASTTHATPGMPAAQAESHYHRPTEHEKLRNYAFDAFGPYPILAAIGSAGIQQAYSTPPEWGQGWDSFGVRLGSNYGIQLITTSTRYVVAEAFREDTLYYRCSCAGFFPRLGHALISTITARRGEDGHRVFSLAAMGAPYAGTMSAALGWYPGRYQAMDGFRMGNYNLAAAAGQNVALEFVYGGPHTLLGRRFGSHGHSADNSN